MKGKRLLIIGAAVALAISGCAGIASNIRRNPLRAENVSNYTFSEHYSANTTLDGVAIALDDNVTATFNKKSGGTATQYYTNGTAVRWYGGGTLAINAGSFTISAITLSFGGTKNNAITASVGTYTDGAANGSGSWSGGASSVTFTQAGTSGQDRISAISVTYSSGSTSSAADTSSTPEESSSSSSSQSSSLSLTPFADVLTAGKALSHDTSSDETYKFLAYVTKKDGNDYWLTETKNETFNQENAIELYHAGLVTGLPEKLLEGAKVEVTMKVKNYNGVVENGNALTADDVVVLEQGTAWSISTIVKTVPQALAVIEGLSNNETTSDLYQIDGYIISVQYTWTANNGMTFRIGESAESSEADSLYIYKTNVGAANEGDCSSLVVGDEVRVVGNLQKYVTSSGTTPELKNGTTTLRTAGPNHPVVVDPTVVATPKTITQINGYEAADPTLIAKVEGVAEDLRDTTYGNFYLVTPQSGESVYVYGAYKTVVFQKTVNNYSAKSKSNPISSSDIGHSVTVYGLVGYHDNAPQLTNALVVVGDTYTSNVTASVSVNDDDMGTATLSSYAPAYGSEVTISFNPAEGYRVKSVQIQRVSHKEPIESAAGVYKFSAEAKNEVFVEFEAIPEQATLEKASSIKVGDVVYLAVETNTVKKQFNGMSGSYGEAVDYTDVPDSEKAPLEVVAGSSDGTFALKLGEVYLAYTGSSNTLTTATDVDDTSSWTITFEGTVATILNVGAEGRSLQYNASNPRFACYTSSQTSVILWKVVDESSLTPKELVERETTIKSLSFNYNTEVSNVAVDVLTSSLTGITGNYDDWSGKTANSTAVYAGQSATDTGAIQIRSKNNNSGIVTTTSGGLASKISVVWNSKTVDARVLDIYGKNTAYSSPTELYDSATQGTLLGTIERANATELVISGDYEYIGIRSADGAIYLDSVSVSWSGESYSSTSYSYSNVALRFGALISEEMWNNLDGQSEIEGYGVKLLTAPGEENPIEFYTDLDTKFPVEANAKQKGDLEGKYYIWNLYIRVEDYSANYAAVAFIRTAAGDVELKETSASAKSLAAALAASGAYAGQDVQAALVNLAK